MQKGLSGTKAIHKAKSSTKAFTTTKGGISHKLVIVAAIFFTTSLLGSLLYFYLDYSAERNPADSQQAITKIPTPGEAMLAKGNRYKPRHKLQTLRADDVKLAIRQIHAYINRYQHIGLIDISGD